MRKKVLIGAGVFTLLVLLSEPTIGNMIFVVLFLGVVPGTSIIIPSWMIFVGCVLGSIAAIRWMFAQPLYIGSQEYQEKLARQLARKKVLAMTATPEISPETLRHHRINAANRRRVAKA